jgi:membrane protease YdiL (CAAX protease family)
VEDNINGQKLSISELKKNSKVPGPVAAGILFSIATIFLTYGGVLLPFDNDYLRSGLGEVLFILLPVLIFLVIGKYNIKDTLKLRRAKPVNYLIIVFLMIAAMPVVAVFNGLVIISIKFIFGKNLPLDKISITDIPTLIIAIIVIGVSAAVCEESLFRGFISKGYDRFGVVASLLATSILFGILHRDIQKGISTILLGTLIGFIVYRTNSIYCGMVAHFTNNAVVVLLTYQTSKLYGNMGIDQSLDFDFSNIPVISIVIVILFYALMFLGFVAVMVALLYALCRTTRNIKAEIVQPIASEPNQIADITDDAAISRQSTDLNTVREDIKQTMLHTGKAGKFSVAALLSVLPGLALIFLTFAGQILYLMDIDTGILHNILKSLRMIS